MKGQKTFLNDFIVNGINAIPKIQNKNKYGRPRKFEFWRSLERLYRTRVRSYQEKLVNMHVTTSAKVGLKVDIKEIEDKVEALLKNKTYKVKLDVDSESIKNSRKLLKDMALMQAN